MSFIGILPLSVAMSVLPLRQANPQSIPSLTLSKRLISSSVSLISFAFWKIKPPVPVTSPKYS